MTTATLGYSRFVLRIERLINLIAALLETTRPLTAAEIRERIAGYGQPSDEAFRRTFERDKEALRSMGVPLEMRPVDALAEQAEGYIIPKERYYLPDLDLEPDELAALRIAAETLLGGSEEATTGFQKLAVGASSVPAGGSRLVWGADLTTDHPLLGALFEALLERKAVSFSYRPGGRKESTRSVEAYGLVHHGGGWYLVGKDIDRDDIRTFKLARVSSSVRILDRAYEIPQGFDAKAHIRQGWEIGEDPPERCVVRFRPEMRWWAEQNMATFDGDEAPGGALDVSFSVANAEALVSWVLQFGDAAEIIAPEAARAAMRDKLVPFLEEESYGGREEKASGDRRPATRSRGKQQGSTPSRPANGRLARRLRRILLMLPYVVRNPGMQVSELAEHLGVKEKQLIADLELLFLCGLPGYGPGDLIDVSIEEDRIFVSMADYFASPLRLTPSEAVSLYVGAHALAALPEMEGADALTRGLEKLKRALERGGTTPPSEGEVAVKLAGDPVSHLRTIEEALQKRRRLGLQYFSAARGELTDREVDPWGLFTALGHWYLIAYDHDRDEERMFRVDRVKAAVVLDEAADPPEDFDPDRYRGAFVGRGEIDLELEIAPTAAEWFEDYYPVTSAHKLADGWTAIEMSAGGPTWAAILVLKLGSEARDVRPEEVRRRARALARSIYRFYAPSASSAETAAGSRGRSI
jgi:proteasome accessory factor BC